MRGIMVIAIIYNFRATSSLPISSSSPTSLPGYSDFEVQPELSTSSRHGSFIFGRASNPLSKHAFIEVPLGNGEIMQVPKGIYHYSEKTRDFDIDAAVPHFGNPFQASGSYKTLINNVIGFYLPMPFDMSPVNLQFLTKQKKGGSLSGDVNSGIDGRLKQAIEEVRQQCINTANTACERALTKYYAFRVKQIEQNDATVQEKLFRMGTELMSEFGSGNIDYNGWGVLVGMPGIEPIYTGAGVDRSANIDTVLEMSLPH